MATRVRLYYSFNAYSVIAVLLEAELKIMLWK